MQTFLPYASYPESARVLDRQRLGKQRVEVLQLLKAILGNGGWGNHPAAQMWRGHSGALIRYGVAVCDEWISRGYKDTCRGKILSFGNPVGDDPPFVGNDKFHASHRSNLLRKHPEHYRQFGWLEPDDLPYVWPATNGS